MAWVVDTCLLLDVALDDPKFFPASARLLDAKQSDGLMVCPVSVVEISPVFAGQMAAVTEFLERLNIPPAEPWTHVDTQTTFMAWNNYVAAKRQGQIGKRPIADVLIGAFAMRFQGLLTRNPSDFRQLFPGLQIIEP
jgi:predicted nucleic acid-binding protein